VLRSAVFDLLWQAATEAGVQFDLGRDVAGTVSGSNSRQVLFADGSSEGPFDLVVDALGQRSVLRPKQAAVLSYGALWASLDWPAQGFDETAGEQRYRAASKMIGVVPSGTHDGDPVAKATFFWSIRSRDLDAWRAAPLNAWKDEVRSLWPATAPLLDGINDHDDLTFAQYRHATLGTPCAPALAHIGDSYHQTSPQLGQGANMALLDAYALAQGIEREATLEAAFDHYIWARALHVRLFQSMSRMFTPVYQSDSRVLPLLRDYAIAPFVHVPPVPRFLAKMVTGLLGNPLGRLGLQPVGAGKRREP
jgi:2-polyprenyl-6-methoxyphenol hydroxylase-like FAD-dependent oxidoreductase